MNSENPIADGKVVSLHYTLRSGADEIIETSIGGEPMTYLHGANNIVPGLEKALSGQPTGYKGKVVVPAAEAYGERVDVPPQSVPRTAFPAQLELEPGMMLMARGPDQQQVPIWVVSVADDQVVVEAQHPLAGETLNFEVEVLEVRDATSEEKEHGHPHGPSGHHHD